MPFLTADAPLDGARAASFDDVDLIAALAARIGRAIDDEPVMSVEDVRAELSHPGLDLADDTLIVVDGDEAIAFAIAYDEDPGRTEFDPLIEPSLPPDHQDALLDALLAWGIERADAFARRRGLTQTSAFAAAAREEQQMFAAFARFGFAYARTFYRMRISLSEPVAPVAVPAGVAFERVDPREPEALRRLHSVDEEGFADHWGFVPRTPEASAQHVLSLAGLDSNGTWIAVDVASGTDVGLLIATDRAVEQDDGWVAELCVVPHARGRGVAKALLATAFDYYRNRGLSGVALGVDADNSTGATALYRAVGMAEEQTWDVWELHLTVSEPDESPADDGANAES
jgi:ribosomal protein S18 acetylase RimI-like enzyme